MIKYIKKVIYYIELNLENYNSWIKEYNIKTILLYSIIWQ